LRHWFHGMIPAASNVTQDPVVAAEANGISHESDDRMSEVVERIDGATSDTIVSHLVRHAEGSTLQERVEDITPTLKIVLGGGPQEPGHGASTLMCALPSDEALLARFIADPAALIRPAIEEAVRGVAPIQVDGRRTTTNVELGGETIPAGSDVFASPGAANRDVAGFGEDAASTSTGPASNTSVSASAVTAVRGTTSGVS
jgi:cytochrome P450